MTTLDDAWEWYRATREQLRLAQRLGRLYWDAPDFKQLVGRDEKVHAFSPERVVAATERGLEPLDDLAVLVLFSVFESVIRAELLAQLRDEADALRHTVLRHAAQDAADGIKNGSFHNNVLEVLKSQVDSNLVE